MDVKDVADGYARNFLIARKLAVAATENHLSLKKQFEKEEADLNALRLTEKENLGKIEFTFIVKASKEGAVFGSVTKDMVEKKLLEKGFHGNIQLEKPLKKTGIHLVEVDLGQNVTTSIKVTLRPEER